MSRSRLAAALALALTLAVPVSAAEEAPTQPLLAALAFIPAGAEPASLQFVDWAQLKELHDGSAISSGSPLADRQRLLLDIAQAEAAPMPLGLDRLGAWSDAWGWDSTDLEWEARVYGDVAVMRFGEHWDAQPFRDGLEGFGYEAHASGGSVTYIPDPEAQMPSQLRLANMHGLDIHGRAVTWPTVQVVISDDGRTAVLSRFDGGSEVMRAGLEADPDTIAQSGHGRAATTLGRPVAASVLDGRYTCSEGMNDWLMGDAREVAASVAPLHRYEAVAAGYTRPDATAAPGGRYVFAYPGPRLAADDLGGRSTLIEEGYPLNDGVSSYQDVAFSLVDSHVEGSQLVMDVAPLNDAPVHVFRHVLIKPTLFAMCDLVPDQA